MPPLLDALRDSDRNHVALGHFNFSEIVVLKAVTAVARQLGVPVLVGVSESEREFIGVSQAAALVKSVRDEFGAPVFLNADHTHSLEISPSTTMSSRMDFTASTARRVCATFSSKARAEASSSSARRFGQ